jgi:hypothetical protein
MRSASVWDRTPWHATQRAAWEALTKACVRVNGKKIGRNDPCVCGRGKKFKVCCIEVVLAEERERRDLERTRGKGQRDLDDHTGRYGVGVPWVR